MSAIDAWMKLQMTAILGDAEALAMVDKVSAEVGANPTEAQRVAVWQRIMLEEKEKKEQPEEQPEEQPASRPRLNTEDVEEVHHDDDGRPQLRMVNDEPPNGLLEGTVLVCDPAKADEKPENKKPDEKSEDAPAPVQSSAASSSGVPRDSLGHAIQQAPEQANTICCICLDATNPPADRLTLICCSTPNETKYVHFDCMVESFEAGNRVCALCRSPTPLAAEDLNRVRAEVDHEAVEEAVEALAPPAPETTPLSSYRLRNLHPSEVTNFSYKIPAANRLQDLLTTGSRRGGAVKVYRVTYAAAEVWRGEVAVDRARALHDQVVARLAPGFYFMIFSGSHRRAFIMHWNTNPMRRLNLIDVAPGVVIEECHVTGRLQGKTVFDVFDAMQKEAVMEFSTVVLHEPVQQQGIQAEAPRWEETLLAVTGMGRTEFKAAAANAKHAKRYGSPTALQLALLLFRDDLSQHLRDCQTVANLSVDIDSVLLRYPTSFAATLPTMIGWEFDPVLQTFSDVTLDTYYRARYMEKAAFFIGSNNSGKTALCAALAKDFTIRKQKTLFVVAKALDPLGLVTRGGEVSQMGAFVFNDTPLRTLANNVLDVESMKSLVFVRESCAFPARYHNAILPAGHARLFTANSGLDLEGNVDNGSYFAEYHQHALATMARRNLQGVLALSDDDRAVLRRVVMFTPSPQDIGVQTAVLAATTAAAEYTAELAVQEAYYSA